VNLEFDFFTDGSAGTKLNTAPLVFTDVVLTEGIFNVTALLSPAVANQIFPSIGSAVWIQVSDVTDAANIRTYPRQRFGIAPFAVKVPVDGVTLRFGHSVSDPKA